MKTAKYKWTLVRFYFWMFLFSTVIIFIYNGIDPNKFGLWIPIVLNWSLMGMFYEHGNKIKQEMKEQQQ